ncbi:hypothetical protein [Chondromyces apiculatus]|uniref:Uncharacterized protein n=1 Tax=Chondromyces apiculatus DSM 436 TaxID=1192034 RepID=A0A017TI49_9BACT|nr:hypothetical protein [Chondromyces apiculatus]EYF08510.1 Hypothetical protein CAP_4040 [Chondromyces apiculatus DSM 436]
MTKTATLARRERERERAATLGPGVHLATVEMRAGDTYRIRTTAGARLAAVLADGVEPALIDDCLRHGRMILACDTERGPTIVGAVQTTRSVGVDEDGALAFAAKSIRLKAEQTLRIEAGPIAITVDKAGVLRLQGDKMTIDMGTLIRLVSTRVELP